MADGVVYSEEYYIASIDLMGIKKLIKEDIDDKKLNQIKNIYKSWPMILKEGYFQDMKIRFFSDNVVVALQADKPGAADKLVETIGWICSHFLRCGYKPRGGICKGKFYIDDIFVWGAGLVDAYILESEEAKWPRIVISEDVAHSTSKHLYESMIFIDEDGTKCLNYLKSFGRNREVWLEDINCITEWLLKEYNEYNQKESRSDEDEKVKRNLKWLLGFVEDNKTFWEHYAT